MADISTHIRELGFIYGLLYSDTKISPKYFLHRVSHIVGTDITVPVSKNVEKFSHSEIITLANGIKLTKAILDKGIITSPFNDVRCDRTPIFGPFLG